MFENDTLTSTIPTTTSTPSNNNNNNQYSMDSDPAAYLSSLIGTPLASDISKSLVATAVENWFTHLKTRHFLVSARVGALAGDPLASFADQIAESNAAADFFSNNALLLSTDEAIKTEYFVKGGRVDKCTAYCNESYSYFHPYPKLALIP